MTTIDDLRKKHNDFRHYTASLNPQDVDALFAIIDGQAAELAALRHDNDYITNQRDAMSRNVTECDAENERLTAELAALQSKLNGIETWHKGYVAQVAAPTPPPADAPTASDTPRETLTPVKMLKLDDRVGKYIGGKYQPMGKVERIQLSGTHATVTLIAHGMKTNIRCAVDDVWYVEPPDAPTHAAAAAQAALPLKCHPDKHQYVEIDDGKHGIDGTSIPYLLCTICNHHEFYDGGESDDVQEYMAMRRKYLAAQPSEKPKAAKHVKLAPTHLSTLVKLVKGYTARRNWQRRVYFNIPGIEKLVKLGFASERREGDWYLATATDAGKAYVAALESEAK
jgi:hypothetical protein